MLNLTAYNQASYTGNTLPFFSFNRNKRYSVEDLLHYISGYFSKDFLNYIKFFQVGLNLNQQIKKIFNFDNSNQEISWVLKNKDKSGNLFELAGWNELNEREKIFVLIELLKLIEGRINIPGISIVIKNLKNLLKIQRFSLITYNVCDLPANTSSVNWCFNKKRFYEINFRLQQVMPDVICFQEIYSKRSERCAEMAAYPFIEDAGNQNSKLYPAGLVTASKYKILKSDFLVFSDSKGIERYTANKGCLLCEIDSPIGTVQVFNSHLYSHESGIFIRKRQISELLDWVRRHRKEGVLQFVTGDFNSYEGDEDFNLLIAECADLQRQRFPLIHKSGRNLYHEMGYTYDPRINRHAIGGSSRPGKLDLMLLANRGALKESCAVKLMNIFNKPDFNNQYLSDHFAVYLEFFSLQ